MESNDTGDLLLMMLDDDLFWIPREKPAAEKPCGDTSTPIRTASM